MFNLSNIFVAPELDEKEQRKQKHEKKKQVRQEQFDETLQLLREKATMLETSKQQLETAKNQYDNMISQVNEQINQYNELLHGTKEVVEQQKKLVSKQKEDYVRSRTRKDLLSIRDEVFQNKKELEFDSRIKLNKLNLENAEIANSMLKNAVMEWWTELTPEQQETYRNMQFDPKSGLWVIGKKEFEEFWKELPEYNKQLYARKINQLGEQPK